MKPCTRNLRRNRKAASPAISAVIITAATVVLVLISGNYALQVLERQRGASEFDTVQKSLLTFDDAFRDIAFDRGGARSVRFTVNYGYMELLPNNETLTVTAEGYDLNFPTLSVGAVKYNIPTSYITFGNEYSQYALGNDTVAVTSTTDSLGRLLASQQSGYLSLKLDYRVRVSREGPSTSLGGGGLVNYIDILVLRMNITRAYSLIGDFDLVAKNLAITTYTSNAFLAGPSPCPLTVTLGGVPKTIQVDIDSGQGAQVIFNLIVADVKVSA